MTRSRTFPEKTKERVSKGGLGKQAPGIYSGTCIVTEGCQFYWTFLDVTGGDLKSIWLGGVDPYHFDL